MPRVAALLSKTMVAMGQVLVATGPMSVSMTSAGAMVALRAALTVATGAHTEAGDQYGITMQPSAMSQLNGQDSLRHGAPENNSLSANQQRGSLSPPRNVPDFTALGSVRLRCRLEWSSQSVAVFSQACWLLTHRCNFSLNPVVLVCISSSTGMHQFTNGAHHDMLCRAAQRCSAGWRMWRAT